MNSKIYLLLLSIMAFSCTSTQKSNNNVIKLNGQLVESDSAYYGSSPILLCDNFLFSHSDDVASKCIISVLEDGRLINSQPIFDAGNGEHEFHRIALAKGSGTELYVLDYPNSCNKLLSLTKISYTETISSMKDSKVWKKLSLAAIPSIRCVFDTFISLSDSTILIPGSTHNEIGHILSVIDYKNLTVTPLNYWPSDGIKCDSLAKHSIYTDNCRIYGNNDNLFLYVCGEERFAFIFSIEGNNIKVKKELYSTYPDYKGLNGNYMINERSGKSLVTAANKKNIYAFLVEDKLIDKRVSRSGNVIEVYNWDGVLEKTIMLDKTGDFIKVSENNDKLYLFSNNLKSGELELWMYDIKGV